MVHKRTRGSDFTGAPAWRQVRTLVAAVLLLLPLVFAPLFWAAPSLAAPAAPTFTVNSVDDLVAAGPLNDGHCATAYPNGQPNGVCTLRAAIMKANHWPGGGATINFTLEPPGTTYLLAILPSLQDGESTGDLNITTTMTLKGGGASRTFINAIG
jgi:hypothetical protein